MNTVRNPDGSPMSKAERLSFYTMHLKMPRSDALMLIAIEDGKIKGDTLILNRDGTVTDDVGEPLEQD